MLAIRGFRTLKERPMTTATGKDVLTAAQVAAALADLPGWRVQEGRLQREFATRSYLKGLDLVNALAPEAEAMNHHPDVLLTWPRVTVQLWTHAQGAITRLDVELARRISRVAAGMGLG